MHAFLHVMPVKPTKLYKLPNLRRVSNWSIGQVELWLKKVELDECIEVFKTRNINGKALLDLTDEKLLQWRNDIKIKHKMQIMKYVRECKNQGFIPDKEPRKKKHSRSSASIIDCENNFAPKIDSDDFDDGWDTDFDDEDDFESQDECGLTFDANKTHNGIDDCNAKEEPEPVNNQVDMNHNNKISDSKNQDEYNENEDAKKVIPKPPQSRISVTNYPKFKPLKVQHNNSLIKRPQTTPPPPPVAKIQTPPQKEVKTEPIEEQDTSIDDEDYEIPNSSCDNPNAPLTPSSSLGLSRSNSNASPPLSPQDVYESLDEADGSKDPLLKVPDVPPEIVPCTPSPLSRRQSMNSPSLPPRRTKYIFQTGSPASGSPPPLPKKPSNSDAKKENDKPSLLNRPLPLPPEQKSPTIKRKMSGDGQDMLNKLAWYHSVDRNQAEYLVRKDGISGMYIIRGSQRGGTANPFTLTIFYLDRVYHLNIRKRFDGLFALGSEKANEMTFVSLADMVRTHQMDPILLSSKGTVVGQTCLVQTPVKDKL